MARLTVKSNICKDQYTLKFLCHRGFDGELIEKYNCADYCNNVDDCDCCGIQQAFDKLAAYENTGLTPEQINALIKEEALWKIKSFT